MFNNEISWNCGVGVFLELGHQAISSYPTAGCQQANYWVGFPVPEQCSHHGSFIHPSGDPVHPVRPVPVCQGLASERLSMLSERQARGRPIITVPTTPSTGYALRYHVAPHRLTSLIGGLWAWVKRLGRALGRALAWPAVLLLYCIVMGAPD